MLQSVWDELDYRMIVCRVTGGVHIENLLVHNVNVKTSSTNQLKRRQVTVNSFCFTGR
ncbi:hypothetical protein C0J52_26710 [Blattella germanica]|nr:hypothetical protein C0J52_26710 [Blattella germanica]